MVFQYYVCMHISKMNGVIVFFLWEYSIITIVIRLRTGFFFVIEINKRNGCMK